MSGISMRWIVARGERSEWGMTESRRPLLGAKSQAPLGRRRTELKLKSLLINTVQEISLHAGRPGQCTWKSVCLLSAVLRTLYMP